MNNETPYEDTAANNDENSYQSAYSNLVYVFSSDDSAARQLATALTRHNHDVVSFSDLEQTLALLKSRGVAVTASRAGPWIAPRDANGFVLHLVQDNGLS